MHISELDWPDLSNWEATIVCTSFQCKEDKAGTEIQCRAYLPILWLVHDYVWERRAFLWFTVRHTVVLVMCSPWRNGKMSLSHINQMIRRWGKDSWGAIARSQKRDAGQAKVQLQNHARTRQSIPGSNTVHYFQPEIWLEWFIVGREILESNYSLLIPCTINFVYVMQLLVQMKWVSIRANWNMTSIPKILTFLSVSLSG